MSRLVTQLRTCFYFFHKWRNDPSHLFRHCARCGRRERWEADPAAVTDGCWVPE